MPQIRHDDSQFPLVVTVWPDGALTDAEVEQWLNASRAAWQKGRHLALHIGVRATNLSSLQRKIVADFTKKNEATLAKVVIASAIVSESPLVRGIVTAINWIAPPPFPQKVFALRTEAEAWLKTHLTSAPIEGRV